MNDNKIIVEIDSELEPIVPDFITNRKSDCLLISTLLERENFAEIRMLGHRMKGAGGSYGFDDISVIGEAIEEASLSGDRATISKSVLQLSDYLERVEVKYI